MPLLNAGTLLENVVLLEVARGVFDHTHPADATAFATSFAMPPITEWWTVKRKKPAKRSPFNQAFLQHLSEVPDSPSPLTEFWSLRYRNVPNLPVCRYRRGDSEKNHLFENGGSNGALVLAMLAARYPRTMHQWINDDGGRYGAEPPGIPSSKSESPHTIQLAESLVGREIDGTAWSTPRMVDSGNVVYSH